MPDPADHTGYIHAVIADLTQEEVGVVHARTGITDGLRWAELALDPEDCPRLSEERGERRFIVSWDEEAGWQICAELEDGGHSQAYEHGLRVDPPSQTVALWVLGHTLEFYPDRPDGPFRARNDHTPALEEHLASYT